MMDNVDSVSSERVKSENDAPVKEKQARRVPMQKRAREKYDAVLDACTVVLAREGYNGTTTSNIANEAGVAIGSLYEYFPNKESIFSAYLESRISNMMEMILESPPTKKLDSPEDAIRGLIHIAVKASQRNREILRVLINEVPGVLDLPYLRDLESKWAGLARALAQASDLDLSEKDVEIKTYILTNALYGFFIRSFFSPAEPDPEEVTEELVKLIVAYSSKA